MNEHQTVSPSVAELARLVNCLDEDSVATLAGVKPSTLDAWRKRGKGPEYILLGRNYLYPIAAIQQYVSGLVRTRTSFNPQLGLM
jgi:hypothetical protein